jgi:hypothetical protein
LQAGEDITTGALMTNSNTSADTLTARVTLGARRGDIQIGYIDAGFGGIDIVAAGSFRATGSTTTSGVLPSDDDGKNIYPSTFFDFLASQGYNRDEVIAAQPDLNLSGSQRGSLVVRPGIDRGGNIPIKISYGDATRRIQNVKIQIFDTQTVTVQILGDRFQSFVIAADTVNFFPGSISAGSNLADLSFEGREGAEVVLPSEKFPENASGLVSGIVIANISNGEFLGSVESILFEGEERPRPDPLVEEQRTRGDIGANAFCEESPSDTLATPGNLLTVDERLMPEGSGQSISTQALDFCNQEEGETSIVSDASEIDEAGEFGSSIEP